MPCSELPNSWSPRQLVRTGGRRCEGSVRNLEVSARSLVLTPCGSLWRRLGRFGKCQTCGRWIGTSPCLGDGSSSGRKTVGLGTFVEVEVVVRRGTNQPRTLMNELVRKLQLKRSALVGGSYADLLMNRPGIRRRR